MKEIKWHETPDYPYAEYNLNYMNISDKPIKVEMEVYIAHVNRKQKDDGVYQKSINNQVYKFILDPGQVKNLQGKLRWDKEDIDDTGEISGLKEEYMPRIIYPSQKSRDAWISCEFVDNEMNESITTLDQLDLESNTENSYSKYFIASRLKNILRNYKYSIEDLITGVGTYNFQPDERFIDYKSKVTIDNEAEVIVARHLDKNSSFDSISYAYDEIWIPYKAIEDKDIAYNKFLILKDAFEIAFSDFKVIEETHESATKIYFQKDNIEIFLEISEGKDWLKNIPVWIIDIEMYNVTI